MFVTVCCINYVIFWEIVFYVLFRIIQTDQHLERLLTFSSSTQFYVVPESLRHGTALCSLPPGGVLSGDLPLNHKLGTKSVHWQRNCICLL